MYVPRYFSEQDETRLFEFIDEVGVGTLITAAMKAAEPGGQ